MKKDEKDEEELEIIDQSEKKVEKADSNEVIDLEECDTGDDVVGMIDFPRASDKVIVEVKCATTKRNYEAIFVKNQINAFYDISDIKEVETKGEDYKYPAHPYPPTPPGSELNSRDASKFNWDDVECPYCYGRFPDEHRYGVRTNVLQCMSCGRMSCGGSITPRGRAMYFKCPWCGKGGVIDTGTTFEEFSTPVKKGKKK